MPARKLSQTEYRRILRREVRKAGKIIGQTGGNIFYCEFIKMDGTIRRMIARLNVQKSLTGEGLPYDPAKKNLCVVWDVERRGYRMVNLATLLYLKCGDLIYDDRA